jgi:hypothetical protein
VLKISKSKYLIQLRMDYLQRLVYLLPHDRNEAIFVAILDFLLTPKKMQREETERQELCVGSPYPGYTVKPYTVALPELIVDELRQGIRHCSVDKAINAAIRLYVMGHECGICESEKKPVRGLGKILPFVRRKAL